MTICENCSHRVVCSRYGATGGMNKCEHHAEERHGRWIKAKDGYHRCSVCNSRGSAVKAHYCHHCGTKMDADN